MLAFLFACTTESEAGAPPTDENAPADLPVPAAGQAAAVFAGGCFWCMETDFDEMPGIVSTTSGYAGGKLKNPTYMDVVTETTGHAEAVQIVYDTAKISYAQVIDYYFRHTDPTDDGGQFCDRGDSYRPAIFYSDETQHAAANTAKMALDSSGVLSGPVLTQVAALDTFWPAERYHQDFHHQNPGRYLPYRMGCGRDRKVASIWAKATP